MDTSARVDTSAPSPSPSPPLVSPRPFSFYDAVMKGCSAMPPRATKRERWLYTYNFSPPSTPRGNHTVHADKTEATIKTDFTPRCTMQHTMQRGIQCQEDAVQAAVTITDTQWHVHASRLSPPPGFPPHPASPSIPHSTTHPAHLLNLSNLACASCAQASNRRNQIQLHGLCAAR